MAFRIPNSPLNIAEKQASKGFHQNQQYSIEQLMEHFKLYPQDRSLAKAWFISYTHDGKRRKVYGKLNELPSVAERLFESDRMIRDLAVTIGLVDQSLAGNELVHALSKIFDARCLYLKPKSIVSYRSKIDAFVRWYRLNGMPAMREVDAHRFLKYLIEQGLSNTTVNYYRCDMKSFFKDMVTYGHIEKNPFDAIKKLRETRVSLKYFTSVQQRVLSEQMRDTDPQLWLSCSLLYYCFIRPGEQRLMKISDIHLDEMNGYIMMRGEISKNSKTEVVVIPDPLKQLLVHWLKYSPDMFLFGPNGKPSVKPLSKDKLYRRHQRVLRVLKFGHGYSLYSWKHTGAISAVRGGVNLKDLQMQLRHHSLDMVNEYLKQLGVTDSHDLASRFPTIGI